MNEILKYLKYKFRIRNILICLISSISCIFSGFGYGMEMIEGNVSNLSKFSIILVIGLFYVTYNIDLIVPKYRVQEKIVPIRKMNRKIGLFLDSLLLILWNLGIIVVSGYLTLQIMKG